MPWGPVVGARLGSIICRALLAAACGPAATDTTVVVEPRIPETTVTSLEPPTFPVAPPRPPLIDIVEDEFVSRATSEPFVPRGVDYFLIENGPGGLRDRFFSPAFYNGVEILDDFAELADLGYNTVWIFLDGCSIGPDCITDAGVPGLNHDYMAKVAAAMRAAETTGLMLILSRHSPRATTPTHASRPTIRTSPPAP